MKTNAPFSIESARAGDLAEVLALLHRSNLPEDGIEQHLATGFVARLNGRVVGSAALEVYEDEALLRSVAVAPELRGHRLGHALTEAALARAAALGLRRVFLLTTTAGAFFPRFGFRPATRDAVPDGVKSSVEFTSACPASALVMEKTLGIDG